MQELCRFAGGKLKCEHGLANLSESTKKIHKSREGTYRNKREIKRGGKLKKGRAENNQYVLYTCKRLSK